MTAASDYALDVQRAEIQATLQRGEPVAISGVLFDLDGTLIDSLGVVEEAWRLWAAEYGITLPSANLHGRTARDLTSLLDVPAEQQDAAVRRLSELEQRAGQRIDLLPGAQEALNNIPRAQWAIVTAAARPVARWRAQVAGLPQPSVLITGDDVRRGKPDPEAFQLGRTQLGCSPEDLLIAVEDSVPGLRAARAAGCVTLGVATSATTRSDLSTVADITLDSLAAAHFFVSGGTLALRVAS